MFLVVLGSFGLAIYYWLVPEPPAAVLSDGTVLQMTDAKIGFTNEFEHGNRIEKLLGDLISTNGWKLGKWNLARPHIEKYGKYGWSTNQQTLSLEFQLKGEAEALRKNELFQDHPRHWNVRVRHWGEDGYMYVERFPSQWFEKNRDGYFGYVNLRTFARTSPRLNVEFQRREDEDSEWKTLGKLSFSNPAPSMAERWNPQTCPVTNRYDEFTAVLGTIQVRQPRGNETPSRFGGIWQHDMAIPFKFFLHGPAVTNWSAKELLAQDASGNFERFETIQSYTSGWIVHRAWRSATPTMPWRLKGHFAQESDFATTNLYTIRIPVPITAPFSTNLGGVEVTAGLATDIMIYAGMPETTTGCRLILIDALNDSGESVKEVNSYSGQRGFNTPITMRNVKTNLYLKVALVRDIEFEFVVQPELVQELNLP